MWLSQCVKCCVSSWQTATAERRDNGRPSVSALEKNTQEAGGLSGLGSQGLKPSWILKRVHVSISKGASLIECTIPTAHSLCAQLRFTERQPIHVAHTIKEKIQKWWLYLYVGVSSGINVGVLLFLQSNSTEIISRKRCFSKEGGFCFSRESLSLSAHIYAYSIYVYLHIQIDR